MTEEIDPGFPIIGASDETGRKSDGTLRSSSSRTPRISVEKLRADLERLSDVVSSDSLFAEKPGGVRLEEITLRVEVSASGEVGFLVASGEASAGASIELKFKRS